MPGGHHSFPGIISFYIQLIFYYKILFLFAYIQFQQIEIHQTSIKWKTINTYAHVLSL